MGIIEDAPEVDLTVPQPSTALATMEDGEQAFDSAPSAPNLDQARIAELLQGQSSSLFTSQWGGTGRFRSGSATDLYTAPSDIFTVEGDEVKQRRKIMKLMNRLHAEINAIDFTTRNRKDLSQRKATFAELVKKLSALESILSIRDTDQAKLGLYKGLDSQHQNKFRTAFGAKKRTAEQARPQKSKVQKTKGYPIPFNLHGSAGAQRYIAAGEVHVKTEPQSPMLALPPSRPRRGIPPSPAERGFARPKKRVKPTSSEIQTVENQLVIHTRADGGISGYDQ